MKTLKRSCQLMTMNVGVLVFFFFIASSYSCGGGVVPYVPTQGGATNSSSGQFFLLEKGAAVEMFDVKKLQPLFRNIVLSGNERKIHPSMEKFLSKRKGRSENDSTQVDDSNVSHSSEHNSDAVPVLNLHRIH